MRLHELFTNSQVSVLRLDHEPQHINTDPDEEVCSHHAINFVEAGIFRLRDENDSWTLTKEHCFISRPGAVHRYFHRERFPSDVCLSIVYTGLFSEEEEKLAPYGVPTVFSSTNRLAYLKYQLARLTREGCSLAWEDWVIDLATAVRDCRDVFKRRYREHQLTWYAERVEAARRLFETRYAESHPLMSVARSVGMSPFQFARIFSELVGIPPHRYLLAVRLNQASQFLLEGKGVTETCFDVGFSNLSHFTRSFRRRFGYSPSSLMSRHANARSVSYARPVKSTPANNRLR